MGAYTLELAAMAPSLMAMVPNVEELSDKRYYYCCCCNCNRPTLTDYSYLVAKNAAHCHGQYFDPLGYSKMLAGMLYRCSLHALIRCDSQLFRNLVDLQKKNQTNVLI